ncbi:tRNA (5-methylaminomethyl-2-thiouridylate)-methyltransferase [Gloeomargarita lithophora Alchichica-D10]|uniref:tRNA-specific 2-thiouridylase MnmA n=1 Tax=Gloeomargarita lithophora Alchichica-D10 TaxID=1188229 RepID=A0A1J0ACR8_9CYAN|nr:tRNA 2-thiouridine(34) synthase MnmA [Gloeomargarita lithophora]APB33732.1 tRNA (5-methylaminomethyl-2-thiouridylate)-methyltransferase [Gloeomargarita lithophora Alchichica-D10]
MAQKRVVVGLSGGVDSSTAAACLVTAGYEVIGLTLWLMPGKGQCCSEGMVDAARICEQLNIPHHVVDMREVFQGQIIDYLVAGYGQGVTPLPCSQCNRWVKFAPMLQYAQQTWGIDRIATGHYAQITYNSLTQRYELRRAVDRTKDQSYFLYTLNQEHLAATLFPLGGYTKAQTRELAAQYGLATAAKPESQDLCLVESHGSMSAFLDRYVAPQTGEIVNQRGQVLGQHQGVHHYTVGQRRGLGIAAPEPLYVLALDAPRNRVVVGYRQEALAPDCRVDRLNWVSMAPPTTPLAAQVQIRYQAPAVDCWVIPADENGVMVQFAEPQFGVTPGQAAVLYQDDVLLGGGIIQTPSDKSPGW